MNKYFLILIILVTVYYLQYNTIENFAETEQSVGGVDDANAINTLAQLAKKLMDGGAKVPGNLSVTGDLNATGNLNITGNILGVGNISSEGVMTNIGPVKKNKVCLHTPADGRRALYIAPQKLDGSDWEWGNGVSMEFHANSVSTNSNYLQIGNDNNAAIQAPTTNTRINNKGIQFGGPNNGGETNSAQITAGLHVPNSLCIVGMGKPGVPRKIDMWAEDKVSVHGHMQINGSLANQVIYFETDWDDAAFGRVCATYFKRSEPNYTKREFMIKNKNGNNWRYEHAIKMGNQIWFYGIFNHRYGGDVNGDVMNSPPGAGDVARQMIPNA
jgi:hypothetical protein